MAQLIPAGLFLLGVVGILGLSIVRTGSTSIYSLDDAYIHLALAENIIQGHYGVNLSEPSAPSSSILWPFLLAPLARTHFGSWMPLAINVVCGLVTAVCFGRLCAWCLEIEPARSIDRRRAILAGLLAAGLVLVTNQLGLVFTGMEHSLQVMLVTLTLLAVIIELRTGKLPAWVWPVLVAGPLVRYENLAVTVPVLCYLALRGRLRGAVFSGGVALALLIGFSLFLKSLGQPAMPASVLAKSSAVAGGGKLGAVAGNLVANLNSGPGAFFTVGMLALIAAALLPSQPKAERHFAWASSSTLALHLAVGRFGWYERYEIYAWALLLLCTIYFYRRPLATAARDWPFARVALLMAIVVGMLGARYFRTQTTTPLGIGNIAQQQYPMHRFVTEYWQQPVAVNDLGWVAYRNDHYVLDLWGLASVEALEARGSNEPGWMAQTVKKNDVGLAMIYTDWLSPIPENWVWVATMRCPPPKITAAGLAVDFYATDTTQVDPIRKSLKDFEPTMPPGVKLQWVGPEDRVP